MNTPPPEDPDDPIVQIPIEREIDLHPFHPRDIPSVVEEYLNEAHAAGFEEVRIVHGRGKGVQRGIVQQTLDRHRLVESFSDDTRSHLGATIVKLRTSKVERRKNTEG